MQIINNWEAEKVIHKDNIIGFDFLYDNSYIEEIADGFYYIAKPFSEIEKRVYEEKTSELADKLGIDNVDNEIKLFIKKLNNYNETKDVAQILIGKIADLRGTTLKSIHEELGVMFEE